MHLPDYDELPRAARGGRSAWGLFGDDDNLGLLNLITPEVTASAARLVATGEVIPLDLPLDHFDPPLFGRTAYALEKKIAADKQGLDEVYNGFNPQASSQWDGLGHVAYDVDSFYNGATLDAVLTENRNTIGHWARKGIATRGVLLDLERTSDAYDPGSTHTFSVEDLERARRAAGVEFLPGDVIILRTGFLRWYDSLPARERRRISTREDLRACGLEHTEDMARYLWNTHAAAVASDAPSLEVWPMDRSAEQFPFGILHRFLLGQFGMGIGELWALETLAARCAERGRHEFFLTSAPLHSMAGVGSPANAMAIL
ncbi:cyclase family protein [Amycolatopsis sp.]|uniref:cyclase family protein n=1 Tax=Amycolatopsis sp. TaxID=37632 RepID=UPI002CFFD744|nr:cyclase family protein [Amycolatopsis sp.]HVV10466.1 cyclase family protein [Amycolatopsis sp.]